MFRNIGGAIGNFGSGIQDFFDAAGDDITAKGLDEAAKRERISARLTEASTSIQKYGARRQIERTTGSAAAEIASSGFSFSGSNIDIAADSTRQGAITEALLETQGEIDVNQHLAQAESYDTQAEATRKAAKGKRVGGFLHIGLGLLSLFL